jgi:hypothetical protein
MAETMLSNGADLGIFYKLSLGAVFEECGWEETPPKHGTTVRRLPFNRSDVYARRGLGEAIRDALKSI